MSTPIQSDSVDYLMLLLGVLSYVGQHSSMAAQNKTIRKFYCGHCLACWLCSCWLDPTCNSIKPDFILGSPNDKQIKQLSMLLHFHGSQIWLEIFICMHITSNSSIYVSSYLSIYLPCSVHNLSFCYFIFKYLCHFISLLIIYFGLFIFYLGLLYLSYQSHYLSIRVY